MGNNSSQRRRLLLPSGQNLFANLMLAAGLLLLLVHLGSINSPAAPPPVEVAAPVQELALQPPQSSSLPPEQSAPLPEQPEPPQPPPRQDYPADKLFTTSQRRDYQTGQMRLVIPKLKIDTAVQSGVSDEHLKQGPGLYDYAQLPSEGNPNVSIAGHRDIHGSIFYYVDQLGEGDRLYLVYGGFIFAYVYEATTIVKANDWGPIYCKDFSCLTLTSCDPIGTSRNRIIITARLEQTQPDFPDYVFAP